MDNRLHCDEACEMDDLGLRLRLRCTKEGTMNESHFEVLRKIEIPTHTHTHTPNE